MSTDSRFKKLELLLLFMMNPLASELLLKRGMQSKWVLVLCLVILLPLSWLMDDQLSERDCIKSSIVNYLIIVNNQSDARTEFVTNPYLKLKSKVIPSCERDYFFKGGAFDSSFVGYKKQIQSLEPLFKVLKGIKLKPLNIVIRRDIDDIFNYSRKNIELSENLLSNPRQLNLQKVILGSLFHQDQLKSNDGYKLVMTEVFYSYLNGFSVPQDIYSDKIESPLFVRSLIGFLESLNPSEQLLLLSRLLSYQPNLIQRQIISERKYNLSDKLLVMSQILDMDQNILSNFAQNNIRVGQEGSRGLFQKELLFVEGSALLNWQGKLANRLSDQHSGLITLKEIRSSATEEAVRPQLIIACSQKSAEKVVSDLINKHKLQKIKKVEGNFKKQARAPQVFITTHCSFERLNDINSLVEGETLEFLQKNKSLGFYQIHLPSLRLAGRLVPERSKFQLTLEHLSKLFGWESNPEILSYGIFKPKAALQGIVTYRPTQSN